MKRTLVATISVLMLLTACATDNSSPTYPMGSDGYVPRPVNPTTDFENTADYDAIRDNQNITPMYMRSENQVADYIDYRLNEWDSFNPDFGDDVNRGDIAAAALFLTNPDLTAKDINNYFNGKEQLFHMAMYVIDNRLDRCFDGGTTPAACFIDWRDDKTDDFNAIATEIKNNAVVLYPTESGENQAIFKTDSDKLLTFIFDNDSGRISGIKFGTGDNATQYSTGDGRVFEQITDDAIKTLQYDSVAREDGVGLTYSDFGHYYTQTLNQNSEISDMGSGVFAGGYASKQITPDVAKFNKTAFAGKAVAKVTPTDNQSHNFYGNATLYVDPNGDTNLTAPFANWYTVVAESTLGSSGAQFTFNDNGQNIDEKYRFNNDTLSGTMNIEYYGPDGTTVTEAVGLINVAEQNGLRADMAFGVK